MADRASGAALNQQGANIDAEEEAHHAFELFRFWFPKSISFRMSDASYGLQDTITAD